MADIARLGFSVETGDLRDGKAALEALVPAATRAQKATENFNRAAAGITGATDGAAAGIRSFGAAVNQAAAGGDKMARGALMAGTAMGTVQRSAVGASAQINVLGGTVKRVGMNFAQADAHMEAYKASLAGVTPAANGATTALDRLGKHANDNINRMQATPGNIAAQFQDIGVTAAAGMNPMIIALQQGTQLSAAMSGGLGNLARAFAQVLSPVTLLTIGLVGLAAAGIQMVNWIHVAQSALNMLANGMDALASSMETVIPVAIALGAVMLIAFGPQILSAIISVVTTIGGALISAIVSATEAMIAFAIANPFTAIVLGVAAAAAAIAYFSGATIDDLKKTIDFIIGGFVGAFNTVKRTWAMLPAAIGDASIQAVNYALSAIDKLISRSVQGINSLIDMIPEFMRPGHISAPGSIGRMGNPYAGSLAKVGNIAAEEMGKAQGRHYVDGFVAGAKGLLTRGASLIRGWAGDLGKATDKAKKAAAGKSGGSDHSRAGKPEKTNDDLFGEVLADADKQMRGLQQAHAQIGVYGEALSRLKFQQDLLNAATDKGVKLNFGMALVLMQRAHAMAAVAAANAHDTFVEDTTQASEAQTRSLNMQQAALGMSAENAAKYTAVQTILNDAISRHIVLSADDVANITAQQSALVDLQTQLSNTKAAWDFARDAVHGFVSDLQNGLEQGKNLFSVFADAVLNVLNKVINKLTDVAIDAALGAGNSSRGFLGALGSILHISGGGGSGLTTNTTAFAGADFSGFAKGSAFTNGIYDSPTMFRFAKGTALGQMGEAGPEAVMPLKRGSDGSLGVQMHGAARSGPPVIHINNEYHIAGSSTADMQATVRQSAEQTRDQLRREVPAILAEYQRNGTVN